MASLSPKELAARLPVWVALSEFWLDTELSESSLNYLAEVLAASPYSLTELRKIHDYEVAPALYTNLLSVAGEWEFFDEDWLKERCLKCASRQHLLSYRIGILLRRRLFRCFTDRYWKRLIPQIVAKRLKHSG